jgi:hypothetical protein
VEEPGHDDRHQLAAAAASSIGEQDDDGRDRGDYQGVTEALSIGLAQKRAGGQIDHVGEDSAQDQEAEIHLGIPEDPTKEEDRTGDVPEDHRSVSDPIECSVGEGVGYEILFSGNVLETMRHLCQEALSFQVQRLQRGVLDPVPALQLADQKLAIGSHREPIRVVLLGKLQALDQSLVFGDVVGGVADGL